jgi:hypothetical protein
MLRAVVFAAAVFTLTQPPSAVITPPQETVTDPDAYAVYMEVLPTTWAQWKRNGPMLLQQETVPGHICAPSRGYSDKDWSAAEEAFTSANSRSRLLVAALLGDLSYHFISRAALQADDARLAIKYPGHWQSRPESIEYAAVSMIGFNPAKTKAVLYVQGRGRDNTYYKEKRDGQWVNSTHYACGGIA